MYPLNLFTLFPPFPRENKIFVAMDFDSKFDSRWKDIIKPAVENIRHNEISLKPYRVDMGKGSESVLTEILLGISRCQLFFADLTTIGYLNKKAIRNGNVMYEVGIAQAVRLPEEVILFRSDNDSLPFDLANLRVNNYDPDNNPDEAKQKICTTIESAFKEINLQKHLSVSRAAESLDYNSYMFLLVAKEKEVLEFGLEKLSKNPVLANSISRLLELGILSTQYSKLTLKDFYKLVREKSPQGLISYKITPFGSEVLKEIWDRAL